MASQQTIRAPVGCLYIGVARTMLLNRLVQWLASLWVRYLGWQARRALLMVLRDLDDRTLADIGLDRGEIEIEVGTMFERKERANAAVMAEQSWLIRVRQR